MAAVRGSGGVRPLREGSLREGSFMHEPSSQHRNVLPGLLFTRFTAWFHLQAITPATAESRLRTDRVITVGLGLGPVLHKR